jgi:DNA topoisomerase IB
VIKLGESPETMMLDRILDRPEAVICAALGGDALVFGLPASDASRTYSNIAEADKKTWQNGVIPMQGAFAETVTDELGPEFDLPPDYRCYWDNSKVEALNENADARATRAQVLFTSSLYPRNQALRSCGFEPVENEEDGELYYGDQASVSREATEEAMESQQEAMGPEEAEPEEEEDFGEEGLSEEDGLPFGGPGDAKAIATPKSPKAPRRAKGAKAPRSAAAAKFEESKHPRKHGKFADKPGGEASRHAKPKAVRSEMHEATRIGTGKDAKVVLASGEDAPPHIKPSMVPPKWSNVRVSKDPYADVLVTAKDEKGRPKTVYSDAYQNKTAEVKFGRVKEMIDKHDQISKEIQDARGVTKTREEADAAWLMQVQATRPGSDRDTLAKVKAYGATTLRAEHVVPTPEGVRLQFVGKEGISHDHLIRDENLGKMLLERKATANERGGRLFSTNDTKVRNFVGTLGGGGFSSKNFRTSAATRLAAEKVAADHTPSKSLAEHKKRVMSVAKEVSGLLGNRPAQALMSYIHPSVFHAWRHDHDS